MVAGYSGTPLARKLGIKEGHVVSILDEPEGFRELLDPVPDAVSFKDSLRGNADVVLFFTTRRAIFEKRVTAAGRTIFPDGAVWICWPKRASRVATDMTEDVVREVALPLGLVDNKVCAVDDIWSGLRIVWRREHRTNRLN